MSVIVTDEGFSGDDWDHGFELTEGLAANRNSKPLAVDLPSDANLDEVEPYLDQLTLIRIDFPSFADGRGFSLARNLRLRGFTGRLRAKGHVLADQYSMARRSGFDEVEIDDDLAERQPEHQWLNRAAWRSHHYQARLKA